MKMGRKRKDQSKRNISKDNSGMDLDDSTPGVPRNSANARERTRMRVLSKAFSKLKTTLPWVPADTKLSKLDTLRLASCYIAHLKGILDEDEELIKKEIPDDKPIHPLNLTWPYTFNGKIVVQGPSSDSSSCKPGDSPCKSSSGSDTDIAISSA